MKNWWLIPLALVAGIVLGRLSVEQRIVTETVVEHHTINTSAISPTTVSEPIGTRIEKVRLVFVDHLRDTAKMVVQEDNFPMIDRFGDSTTMVDHIEEVLEMVEGLSNGCLIGPSNSQPVTNCNGLDFVTAELPIRDYTFTDDSTYRITARGVYVESLPQIEFTPQVVTTTRTEKIDRTPRITHGFQLGAGAALTPKGLQPAMYFGYGFSIKF